MEDETPLSTRIALGLCVFLLLYLLTFGGSKKAFINVEKVVYTDKTETTCEYDSEEYWDSHTTELANPKGSSAHSKTNK